MDIQIETMRELLCEIESLYGEMDEDSAHAKRLESLLTQLDTVHSDMVEESERNTSAYRDKETQCEQMQSALNSTREYLDGVWREQNRTTGVNPVVDQLLAELDDALEVSP